MARHEAARQAADLTVGTSGVPSECGVEETYSPGTALAQQTQDLALADAERQNILDQTTADNTQRGSDAAANAAFLSAQYAAKTLAMQTLVSDLNNAPWAQYQVVRAAAEEAAWDGTGPSPLAPNSSTLAQDYVAWQQQVSTAYTTYANARAAAYYTQATDIANRTYTDAQYSAQRTAQEVTTLAGDEQSFETQLATKVYTYRTAMAGADQTYYDAQAAATRDETGFDYEAYSTWLGVTDDTNGSAANDYQSAYVTLDGQRRHDMATEGLSFVNDLAGAASTAASAIATDQAGFDIAAANAYYQGTGGTGQGTGLEFTLASLAQNYDIHYATVFANSLGDLANFSLGTGTAPPTVWSPWARLAAVDAQTQLTTVDIPSANAAFADRIAQAVTDNATNIAAGVADRAQWLSDLTTNSSQAISAAQVALASANAGGDPSSVSAPGDLAVPTNLDLGAVTVAALDSFVSGGTGGALGRWTGDRYDGGYTPGWGDPFYSNYVYGGYYNWFGSGAYGWGTGYYNSNLAWWGNVGYGWWGGAGLSFPSGVSDPFDTGITPSTPPAPVDPTAAVTQEQTEVNTLSTLAAVGKDVLAIAKNAAPLSIKALTGVAEIGAAAGYASVKIGAIGQTGDGNQSNGEQSGNTLDSWFGDDGDDYDRDMFDFFYGFSNDAPIAARATDPWSAAMAFNNASGYHWDGLTVLEIIKAAEGQDAALVADFVARHYALHIANDYSSPGWAAALAVPRWLFGNPTRRPGDAQVTITGAGGALINTVNDIVGPSESHIAKIDVGIPDSWDSAKVAQFILSLPRTNDVVNKIAQDDLAGRSANLFSDLQLQALDHAAHQAAAVAGPYYKMLAGFTTAGAVAVAIYALGEGDLVGAALEVVFMAPVLHFIGNSVQTVALKVGEEVIGHIPVELLARFAKLPEAVKSKFLAVFRSGKGDAEVLAETERLLKQEGVITSAEAAAGLTIRAGKDGLNEFARAWQFGVQPYENLVKQTAGSGLRAHHLLERRFANILGVDEAKMQAIALTPAEHQVFTNAWRKEIPYVTGTNAATRKQITDAARKIYANHPDILRALGL